MRTSLPRIGLGTWSYDDPEQCTESVVTALEAGYRHVDTAQAYANEEAVGRGIEAAGVDREDILVATKVDTDKLAYDDVIESTHASRDRLGLDVIDLLYIHWPRDTYDPEDTLAAFDDLVDDGIIRSVGVSNFELRHLEEAREHLDAPIFANQVEMHPLLDQSHLLADAREHEYQLVAYSPLARGELFDNPVIQGVADQEGITPAQVSLAWLCSKDSVSAVPKATGEEHILANFAARNHPLSDESIETLDDLADEYRVVDYEGAPWDH